MAYPERGRGGAYGLPRAGGMLYDGSPIWEGDIAPKRPTRRNNRREWEIDEEQIAADSEIDAWLAWRARRKRRLRK